MATLYFTFLNGSDIGKLDISGEEIIAAVEAGLRAQGEGKTVIEPRVHLEPGQEFSGHFSVYMWVPGMSARNGEHETCDDL